MLIDFFLGDVTGAEDGLRDLAWGAELRPPQSFLGQKVASPGDQNSMLIDMSCGASVRL
ncbi:hypothetical protein [Pseudooceanicola nitratireducens]|uniref:hypothetical protein n=1 Tax=Pseudooceanicola nitratireducens TaxID=517719 RepID=UPI003C7A1540